MRVRVALRFLPCTNRLLVVDFDVFLDAAIGDRDHDAKADRDRDSDQCPRCADSFQNTHFPERGQNAASQENKTNQIHACPFHMRRIRADAGTVCVLAYGRKRSGVSERSSPITRECSGQRYNPPI